MVSRPTYNLPSVKYMMVICYYNKKTFLIFGSYQPSWSNYNVINKIFNLLIGAKISF